MTRLIGRVCKYSNVLSWPVLIGRGLDQKRACFSVHAGATSMQFSGYGLCTRLSLNYQLRRLVFHTERRATSLLVVMARGYHPFPSRTRQLSPSAPMVLAGRPAGRVGHCKESICKRPASQEAGLFIHQIYMRPCTIKYEAVLPVIAGTSGTGGEDCLPNPAGE